MQFSGKCGKYTYGDCNADSTYDIVQGIVEFKHKVTVFASEELFSNPCASK